MSRQGDEANVQFFSSQCQSEGSQLYGSQSAPQNEKIIKISETWSKTELNMAPKRASRVKKSFKSWFFRNQKRFLKTELKPVEKHKKWVQMRRNEESWEIIQKYDFCKFQKHFWLEFHGSLKRHF